MTKLEAEADVPTTDVEPSTTIDEVLDHTDRSSRGRFESHVEGRVLPSAPLLGHVTDLRSLDFPGRVLVKWRDVEGRDHERWLMQVRGLDLAEGDEVLLTKPANRHRLIVTAAIQKGHPAEKTLRMDVDTLKDQLDIHVDGSRLELEAQEEVVLRCGEAAIVLRSDGRVEIQGTHVETCSTGANRIKGATVQIN